MCASSSMYVPASPILHIRRLTPGRFYRMRRAFQAERSSERFDRDRERVLRQAASQRYAICMHYGLVSDATGAVVSTGVPVPPEAHTLLKAVSDGETEALQVHEERRRRTMELYTAQREACEREVAEAAREAQVRAGRRLGRGGEGSGGSGGCGPCGPGKAGRARPRYLVRAQHALFC